MDQQSSFKYSADFHCSLRQACAYAHTVVAIVDLQLGRLTSDFKSAPRFAPGSDLIGFCVLLPQAHGLAMDGFFTNKVRICCPCPPRHRLPICLHILLSVLPPISLPQSDTHVMCLVFTYILMVI
jgi:hypothetical protein